MNIECLTIAPLAMMDGGAWYAFQTSSLAGKLIVIILFIGSIFTWSVMITKYRTLLKAAEQTRRFLVAYRKEGHPASLFLKRQRHEASPLYPIYERACAALGAVLEARGADPGDLFMGAMSGSQFQLGEVAISRIRNVAERTMADQALLMEASMGFLATSTTAAPFLGLLGTVWGVMDAFSRMVTKGAAMLSAVAPGIAGALLTTVVGLLVALPSSIGYNMLTDRIRGLTVEMDNFCQELISDLESHYRSV